MYVSHIVPRSRKKSFVRGLSSGGGSFRGSVASLGSAEIEEMNSLYYQDILGVVVKKEKKSSNLFQTKIPFLCDKELKFEVHKI